MILKYEEYVRSINEKKETVTSFDSIKKNSKGYMYSDIMQNMKRIGYRFTGTIYCQNKNVNVWRAHGFDSVFSNEINEYWDEFYDGIGLDVSIDAAPGVDEDDFEEVISRSDIMEVTSCSTKTGKTYYVFFNREKRYFYFLYTSVRSSVLDMWLRIKTGGQEEAVAYLKDVRARNERLRAERERREEAERKDRTNRVNYEKECEKVKDDVKEHPEKYPYVAYNELPESVRKFIENKTMYKSDWLIWSNSYYESEYYTNRVITDNYIADKNLTKGFMFKTEKTITNYVGD